MLHSKKRRPRTLNNVANYGITEKGKINFFHCSPQTFRIGFLHLAARNKQDFEVTEIVAVHCLIEVRLVIGKRRAMYYRRQMKRE